MIPFGETVVVDEEGEGVDCWYCEREVAFLRRRKRLRSPQIET